MNRMIKAVGLVLVFAACFLAGAYKSRKLNQREKGLAEIRECMEELSSRLFYEGCERIRLLGSTLGKRGIICFENGIPQPLECGIGEDDKKLLEEFLSSFGSSDTNSEYERIKLYTELFERNRLSAAKENEQLSRLYRTLGICAGAAGCLILI